MKLCHSLCHLAASTQKSELAGLGKCGSGRAVKLSESGGDDRLEVMIVGSPNNCNTRSGPWAGV